jgi:hypothetical protein
MAQSRHAAMSGLSPLMKIGRETGIPDSVISAAGGACNAVRLSYAAVSELTVFNGRTTAQQAVTNASTNERCVHGSYAD